MTGIVAARWDRRRLAGVVVAAVLVVAATIVEVARTGDAVEGLKAFGAAVIAVAVGWFATTLPGITLRGVLIGAVFVVAGIFTWTFTSRPILIWAVLGLGGVLFAVWTFPWRAPGGRAQLREWYDRLRTLPRVGTAWLGLAYWLLGIVGAVLVGHLGVAAQRVAYAGVFTLAALAVLAAVRHRGGGADPSVGIAAAIIGGLALLFLFGSGSLFDARHAVPDAFSARLMTSRFWGGDGLYYHPNSMAGLAVVAALRIGPDRAFALWQRWAAMLLAGFLMYLSDARTAFVFAVAAAAVHAVLLWRGRHTDLPTYRRRWVAALAPFAVVVLVLVLLGGRQFLFQSRLSNNYDPTSGRLATWSQVWTDWRQAPVAEKLFGDARTSRAVVHRSNDGNGGRTELNTDDAFVGSFRRGGVLGALAFLVGLALLLWHAVLRRWGALFGRAGPGATPGAGLPAAWFTVAALAAVPTIVTEDWMLGGTNGVLWILVLAGEAVVVLRTGRAGRAATEAATAPAESPPQAL
ncbi:MAG: O-antigen ligase family protein, partial [Micromonosporaceae bacterium]|nr:O-antigen ligase family protein [Micromonosporaceae bacterium]